MKLDFQLSEEYKDKIRRRNRFRLKAAAVFLVLAVIGCVVVRIIS
ncbi:hypothetical protein [uncultured Ruminococcus sp.]|nr:hypothetical protein [uncultured Ruminococcus sp.]